MLIRPSAPVPARARGRRSHEHLKPLFILFVAIHLLIDLAMPTLPGAFRFNVDESVLGIRAQAVQIQHFKPAPLVNRLLGFSDLQRLETRTPVDPPREVNATDLTLLLPRRDPSADRSLPRLTEDH
jgi:hypothetical protein